MAKKKLNLRFRMDTTVFASIWKNHIDSDDDTQWRRFVLNCFSRFTDAGHGNNKVLLHDIDPKWTKWDDDAKYDFLSEKSYAKCITIRRRLKKDNGLEVSLPSGYKNRAGGSSKRVTSDDLAAIFAS